jgi:Holliday junction resolvase RusA-like endonuclease
MIDCSKSDVEIALDVIRRLIGPAADPDRMFYFIHAGDPVSKARARVVNGHAYTPRKTASAEEALAWRFRSVMKGDAFDCPVAIAAVFFRSNYQRIDADNMMKLVLDAGTAAHIWIDDCHVAAQLSFVECDPKRPRTIVVVCPTTSTMDRTGRYRCEACDKKFYVAGRSARFCSPECRIKAYVDDRSQVRCARCEGQFKRGRAGQRYCSRACMLADPLRRQKLSAQRPWPICESCGGRVSRREYLRCSKCSTKGRQIGSKNKPRRDDPLG